MKMTDEARKAAGDRMRALNAKRKMQKEKVKPWRDTVVIIDTEFGPKQVPPRGDVIQVNLRAPEYTWLNVYFEDGRAFKIPVDHILQITNPIAPLTLTGREIVSLAETLEWAQLRGKAIPIVREQAVDETKAWRMARKELR